MVELAEGCAESFLHGLLLRCQALCLILIGVTDLDIDVGDLLIELDQLILEGRLACHTFVGNASISISGILFEPPATEVSPDGDAHYHYGGEHDHEGDALSRDLSVFVAHVVFQLLAFLSWECVGTWL